MRLWWVEVRRLFARRFTRLALLLLVGVIGAMVVTAGYGSQKVGADDVVRAERAAAQERADQRARCEAAHATPPPDRPAAPAPRTSSPAAPRASVTATPRGSTPATPRATATPRAAKTATPSAVPTPTPRAATTATAAPTGSLEPALPGEFEGVDCAAIDYPVAADLMGYRTFTFGSEMPGRVAMLAALLALVGYLVGASYVGAEWQHGTMAGLLLWEPRRAKVYTAKLFALLAGLLVVGAAAYAVAFAAHWVVADLVGDSGGVGPALQRSLGLAAARGLALALVIAACGFAIAYAARLSAAALGVAIAYIIGAEVGLRLVSDESARWLLTENITAWLMRGTKIYLSSCDRQTAICTDRVLDVSMWQGGAYIGGLTLVLTVVAAVIFARRDVT
jgi:ABC-type transport system involved in multi-copper enzyme maturation permease subunit